MCALDALVVVTALPTIGHDLRASQSTLQWTVNAYGITWAAFMITAAALGDRFGRRRMFTAGVALFTASSVACALAPDMGTLIAARAAQGVGAATVLPLSLTILAGVFPPERRGTMIGIWGGIGGIAIAAGPLIGGGLTQALSWHWIFWINAPIGVAVLALSGLRLAESQGPGRRLDLPGAVLVSAGAAALIWSLARTSGLGWGNAEVVGGFVAGTALVAGFIWWEGRAPEPMVPLGLFRNLGFTAANATSFLMTGALLSAGVYVSVYLQFVHGDSPLRAGVHFLPMMAAPLFVAPLSGMLSDKVGRRVLIVSGLVVEGVGLSWFAVVGTAAAGYGALVPPMVLAGVGLSMAQTTTPTAALGAVPPAEMGKASGVNGSLTRFGGAFGVAVTTAVFAAKEHLGTPAGVASGIRPALYVAAAMAGLGAVAGLAIRGGTRRPAREAQASRPSAAVQPTAAAAAVDD
jgi:EmrB/QacA subfamily drug resistance transporter